MRRVGHHSSSGFPCPLLLPLEPTLSASLPRPPQGAPRDGAFEPTRPRPQDRSADSASRCFPPPPWPRTPPKPRQPTPPRRRPTRRAQRRSLPPKRAPPNNCHPPPSPNTACGLRGSMSPIAPRPACFRSTTARARRRQHLLRRLYARAERHQAADHLRLQRRSWGGIGLSASWRHRTRKRSR